MTTPKQAVLIRGRPQLAKPKPTRAVCEHIAKQVATKHNISLEDLIYSSKAYCRVARAETWANILDEVGCATEVLADVWGVSKGHLMDLVFEYRQKQSAACARKKQDA